MEENIKEMLGVNGIKIDPYEIAAFMPERHDFKKDYWRFVFLFKSGETMKSDWMNYTCFRSWDGKLQVLFDYIHPGEIEEWKVKKGFTGYLDMTGVKTQKMKDAEKKCQKEENPPKKKTSMKDLFDNLQKRE